MAWISPTDYSDADSKWTNETNAYDGDTSTYAKTSGHGGTDGYLELKGLTPIICDSIRIYTNTWNALGSTWTGSSDVYLDAEYNGTWHSLASGTITGGQWEILSLAIEATVTRVRIRSSMGILGWFALFELQFNVTQG